MEEKMNETSVRQAYPWLVALKNNLPSGITVDQKYVAEFHSILVTLEKESGQDFGDYRVPGSELRHRTTNKNTFTGEVSYSQSPECPRAFLMMKIDAILGYLTTRAEHKTMGFNAR